MEVTARYNMSFILLPKVKNEPGIGEEIMGRLYELGVDVEYFNALALMEETADIIIMVRASDIERAIAGVNKARRKVKGERPVILTELTGVLIRGVGIKESSSVLHRAFAICSKFKVNVLMSYTTLTAVNLFVESENLSMELLEALRKEFEAG